MLYVTNLPTGCAEKVKKIVRQEEKGTQCEIWRQGDLVAAKIGVPSGNVSIVKQNLMDAYPRARTFKSHSKRVTKCLLYDSGTYAIIV